MSESSNLYAGGYYLVLPTDIPHFPPIGSTSKVITTASQHLGTLEISSLFDVKIEELGIPESKSVELQKWSSTFIDKEYGYPNVFYTLAAAHHYVKSFIIDPPDGLVIVCPAIKSNLAEKLLLSNSYQTGRGTYDSLVRRKAPEESGAVMGYETLCYEYDIDCSWWCYPDLVNEAFEKYDIKPNSNGFLDNFDDAKKVGEIALEMGIIDCIWHPWLVIQYPIHSE